MTFANLAASDALFVDANTLTYHFEPHARWGPACTQLLQRIENQPRPIRLVNAKSRQPAYSSRPRATHADGRVILCGAPCESQ